MKCLLFNFNLLFIEQSNVASMIPSKNSAEIKPLKKPIPRAIEPIKF